MKRGATNNLTVNVAYKYSVRKTNQVLILLQNVMNKNEGFIVDLYNVYESISKRHRGELNLVTIFFSQTTRKNIIGIAKRKAQRQH